VYYVFDLMVLAGRDMMREPFEKRRDLLEKKVLPKLIEPVRYASSLDSSLPVLVQSVKAQGRVSWPSSDSSALESASVRAHAQVLETA